jgi:Fe-S cluster assembly iron-binding protein IscA
MDVVASCHQPIGVSAAATDPSRREGDRMLTLTPAAAAAVITLLQNPDLPEGAGLRLQRGFDAGGEPAIGIGIVSEPEPGDEVALAPPEAEVFMARDVVELLEDQVLDAEIEDENVAFTIRPHPVNGGPSSLSKG